MVSHTLRQMSIMVTIASSFFEQVWPQRARRFLLLLVAALLAVAATSCVVQGESASLAVGDRGEFPTGPYGTAEGSTLDDLVFVTGDGQSLSIRDIHADPDNRLLIVLTSAGWCTACIEEQPALEDLHQRFGGQGLFILLTLFEDKNFLPADEALVRDWVRRYGVNFAVVADPEFILKDYYDERQTPMNMIVDLSSMRIERIFTGSDPAALENIINARL